MPILSNLLEYNDIVIQCHDNPDADAIGSGYALYEFFKSHNKSVRLIYCGRFAISKPNLLELVEKLQIPIEYVDNITCNGLLITVDCQYGAGNVKKLEANHVAIIDHHEREIFNIEVSEIRSFLGSCSTLVWQLLRDEGFDLSKTPYVSTALYYGLFTDTNNFTEIYHPLDKDMRDGLNFNVSLIRKLQNSNLSLLDIETAGVALLRCSYNEINGFAVFKAHPCDPNILGVISDLALQVNEVNTCVVYNHTNDGVKFSLRSCVREVMASEMASFLVEGIGSGGGHRDKAGGFIREKDFSKKHFGFNMDAYFLNRIKDYYHSFEVVKTGAHGLVPNQMKTYKKKNVRVGFVCTSDVFPEGTPLIVRTLEGDADINASENIYVIIGILGEVYPIKKEKFEISYTRINETIDMNLEYFPSVKNKISGESVGLNAIAKACISSGESYIYAQPISKNTKVFTTWDTNGYMSGKPGDFIALRHDDLEDAYLIRKDIFYETYEEVPNNPILGNQG